jgi:Uma2 family endonuclease
MKDLVEDILHSPLLPEYAEAIQKVLTEEGHRRQRLYDEIGDAGSWEFICGEVVKPAPVHNRHLVTVMRVASLFDAFVRTRDVGLVHSQKCMCRFQRNDYEPDVVFFGPEKAAKFNSTTMLFPPPDLVVEVLSDSTAERDRGVKFEDYERHVAEYWIVDAEAGVVEQYVKREAGYMLKMKADNGLLICEAIPGFNLPVRAMFDEAENLEALKGLAGVTH